MNTTKRLEKVNIDRLVPYARNARTHSKEQILAVFGRKPSKSSIIL